MNVRLMDRDFALLLSLYDRTLMSFRQISELHFAGRSKSVVHNRLTELQEAGMLGRQKLGRIFHHLENKEIGVVFQITRVGIKHLQLKFPEGHFRLETVPINSSTLYHDLVLGDVLEKLKLRFPVAEFVSGKLIPTGFVSLGRVPDALAEWPTKKNLLAVELELTGKSEKRYRHIFMQYRMQEQYSCILYVTNSSSVREKIEALLTHKTVQGLEKPITGKFYFADLNELMRSPLDAKITNNKEELNTVKIEKNNPRQGVINEL